jgi:hypothetical protein
MKETAETGALFIAKRVNQNVACTLIVKEQANICKCRQLNNIYFCP